MAGKKLQAVLDLASMTHDESVATRVEKRGRPRGEKMKNYGIKFQKTVTQQVVVQADSAEAAQRILDEGAIVSTSNGDYLSFNGSGMGPGAWVCDVCEDRE